MKDSDYVEIKLNRFEWVEGQGTKTLDDAGCRSPRVTLHEGIPLLCVFVAAEEWSESEMSRDMWPSFPGMLELCGALGATMWRFQTPMSLSNMTHCGCAINTTITVFDSLYPTRVLRT